MSKSPPSFLNSMREMIEEREPNDLPSLGEISNRERTDPFKVLVATILSQRTRDQNTSKAVENLFSKITTPEDLARLDDRELATLIRPAGFYNVKARRLKQLAAALIEKFRGEVPVRLDDLLSLPGVGRKTANCVLVYAFRTPAIPVDTHVHRIANRLGLVCTKSPDHTEAELERLVSQEYWLAINELFVRFGQTVCKPVKPLCNVCRLTSECKFYAATLRSRSSR